MTLRLFRNVLFSFQEFEGFPVIFVIDFWLDFTVVEKHSVSIGFFKFVEVYFMA